MSTKNLIALLCFAIGSFTPIFAQEYEINAANLLLTPKEVKEKSNAVIKYEKTAVKLLATDKMSVRYRKVITIGNKRGDRYSQAYVFYDPSTKVKKLGAKIYNVFGKEIKKFKKGDFLDETAADGVSLYNDDRVKYLKYVSTSYPYTIDFEYEIETSTTAFLFSWRPVGGSFVGVQKSEYHIDWEPQMQVHKKEYNLEGYNIVKDSTANSYRYSIENLPPFKSEDYEPLTETYIPYVRFRTNTFHLHGVTGQASNWKEFGKWMANHLLQDVNDLPIATKAKMRNITQGISDPLEKARKVVDYMQNNTRYISVQIGVGGWKPMKASEVDVLGYGDCKALSNYTKSLLEAVGVKSYYTIIFAESDGPKQIDPEFASMQGNHAILAIEDRDGNLVWNDCTSQVLPFGFIGDFTDNRYALVIKPEGGEIVKTVHYKDTTNSLHTDAKVFLQADGSIRANLNMVSRGIQYDNAFRRERKSKRDQEMYYKQNYWRYLNNLHLHKMQFNNDKKQVAFTESFELSIDQYLTKIGENYLFSPNIFNRGNMVPDRYRNRKRELAIYRGWIDEDRYEIQLPEGYQTGGLPPAIKINTEYGSYEARIEHKDNNSLHYYRKMRLKAGKHSVEAYKVFRSFMKKVNRSDNMKIEILKIL